MLLVLHVLQYVFSLLKPLNSLVKDLLLEDILSHLHFDRVFLAYDLIDVCACHIPWRK